MVEYSCFKSLDLSHGRMPQGYGQDGDDDGWLVGSADGFGVGEPVGFEDGLTVGLCDGLEVGECVGFFNGLSVGLRVGVRVGGVGVGCFADVESTSKV